LKIYLQNLEHQNQKNKEVPSEFYKNLPDVQGSTGGLLMNGKFHYASGGYVMPEVCSGWICYIGNTITVPADAYPRRNLLLRNQQ